MRAAVYVRCSTTSKKQFGDTAAYLQNPEVQVKPLLQLLENRGWTLHLVYSDRMSGSKEVRPGMNALMADARRGLFRGVVVWRFDRFARSVKQLVLALEEFRALGIDFISHQEALDTCTPMGKAMFTIVAAMAELERSVIRERVIAGLEYAREHGTKSGRPVGRPRRVFDREQVWKLRAQGLSLRSIAKYLDIGVGTIVRTLAKREQAGSIAVSGTDVAAGDRVAKSRQDDLAPPPLTG
jgi:DNA invertase Pin-like site-specific DNA recombinase